MEHFLYFGVMKGELCIQIWNTHILQVCFVRTACLFDSDGMAQLQYTANLTAYSNFQCI